MSNEELYKIISTANVLKSQGYYNKALTKYEQALKHCIEDFGARHKDTATIYTFIGIIYKALGQYEKALDKYSKALDIYMNTLESNNPIIAKLYNYIGLSFSSQEKFDEALLNFEKSLQTYVSFLSTEKTIVTDTYNNMGLIFDLNLEYNEALENFDRTLHIKLSSLLVNHPESDTDYTINDSIYKSKLNFYNSYKILQKDIDKELEKKSILNSIDEENYQTNIKIHNVFKNTKKVVISQEQESL